MSVAVSVETAHAPVARVAAAKTLAACTIFLGAFLLFQIQPVLAKMALPWFGGSAAVWTTCMLFFQGVLFLGYLYAHALIRYVRPSWQGLVHTLLLIASLAWLPAAPGPDWKPTGHDDPVPRILGMLAASVGLPYFLLSATSPLVQAWLSRQGRGVLPYRFYALSNLASLAALLAYPVLIEPLASTTAQAHAWSWAYLVYVAVSSFFALSGGNGAPAPAASIARGWDAPGPSRLTWLLLAAIPSVLSLAVTNHLCQNVAAVPFLWVLPLSVYLLSLILCFDRDGWYRRKLFLVALPLTLGAMAYVILHQRPETNVKWLAPFFALALFVCCMYLHGELAQRRPGAHRLTEYYLMLSLGGALGALLVALAAPYLLKAYFELPLAMVACAFALLFIEMRRHWALDVAWTGLAVCMVVVAATSIQTARNGVRVIGRNFYGGLRVLDAPATEAAPAMRVMAHGAILHGTQLLDPARRRQPTAYYGAGSGIERVLAARSHPGRRVGVVGLGAGVLAVYGRAGDSMRFYELNPMVEQLARSEFTFLGASPAHTEVVLGDGRLSLEREPPQNFDVLAIDAFSGDSIPVHLLSREAFELYFKHLRPGGVLAFHISNSVLDLSPVVVRIAQALGKEALRFHAPGAPLEGRLESVWMVVAAPGVLRNDPALWESSAVPRPRGGFPVWTDNYSNLLQVLK